MKILLTGTNGQLGHDLLAHLKGLGELVPVTRAEMNLEDLNQIRTIIRAIKPDLIVSPAAYTAVAQAETDVERATRVNADASEVIAQEAGKLGAALISYSTDYVFDGKKDAPYTEEDPVNPLNVYGKTKLAGEEAIRHHCPAHWILRTSWVYSTHGGNFMKTVIRLAQEKDALTMVQDQVGAPTWSRTISQVTRDMLLNHGKGIDLDHLRNTAGTYHLASAGETSWYQYALLIVEELYKLGRTTRLQPSAITPVNSDPAALPSRPANSRLSCNKLTTTFGITLPDWEQDARRCINEMICSPG